MKIDNRDSRIRRESENQLDNYRTCWLEKTVSLSNFAHSDSFCSEWMRGYILWYFISGRARVRACLPSVIGHICVFPAQMNRIFPSVTTPYESTMRQLKSMSSAQRIDDGKEKTKIQLKLIVNCSIRTNGDRLSHQQIQTDDDRFFFVFFSFCSFHSFGKLILRRRRNAERE